MSEASMVDPLSGPADAEADSWIGVAEAARILHLAPSTVNHYAAQGRIPHSETSGGRFRFRRRDIEALAIASGYPRCEPNAQPAGSGRRRREGPRDAHGHVRPQRAQRLIPRLAWPEMTEAGEGTRLSGPGWCASVLPAGAGWTATLALESGEELHWPTDPLNSPKTLDGCKRWVRYQLEVAANPAVRVRRRGEAPAIPKQAGGLYDAASCCEEQLSGHRLV